MWASYIVGVKRYVNYPFGAFPHCRASGTLLAGAFRLTRLSLRTYLNRGNPTNCDTARALGLASSTKDSCYPVNSKGSFKIL